MTYDYGGGAAPRGQGQYRDRRNESADVGGPPHSGARAQRPSYDPRPQWSGEGQQGSRPYGTGYGEPQPAGPYRDREYGTSNQYGNASPYGDYGGPPQYGRGPSQTRTAAAYGDRGAGPGREPTQYGAARRQPPATYQEPGRADAGPKAGRRSRKPLVFVIILVLLIGGGAGWYHLQGSADRPATEQDRRIADQRVDPVPLTVTEVFGAGTIPGGNGSYKVLKTQASSDCKVAAGGAVAEILTTAGCTQVVRATLTSADGALVITAGIFNLETDKKAAKAAAAIKSAVDTEKGRFGGLVAGGPTNIIARAAANLAWDVRGHYVVYCLVANADGSAIAADDSRTRSARDALVKGHLGDVVIHKRGTSTGAPAVPSTQPS